MKPFSVFEVSPRDSGMATRGRVANRCQAVSKEDGK